MGAPNATRTRPGRAIFIFWPVDPTLLRGQAANLPRMPPDQPLPEADILLIERWLLEGAQDN